MIKTDLKMPIDMHFFKISKRTWVKVVRCRRLAGVGQDTEVGWCSKEDSCRSLIFLNALSAASK